MPASVHRDSDAGAGVRAAAARAVAEILGGEVSLAAYYSRWARSGPDAVPLLRSLVTESLRWHYRLSWQLSQLLDKPLKAKDAELAALLRIGLAQLQFLRIPDHAAVAETVNAAALLHRRHARGLVNAVLRRFLRERDGLETRLADDEQARVNSPTWLIDVVRAEWPQQADAILAACNEHPPQWLRVNTRRIEPAQWRAKLDAAGIAYSVDAQLPAAVRLDAAMPAAQLPGFDAGEVSIQDRTAQLAAGLLELRPGLRVLDACAAPGGKTAAILESCEGLAQVVALDSSAARLAALERHLRRLQLRASVICADAAATQQWWDGAAFDRILLDAPCSATGVIRRHPDIRIRRSSADIERAVAAQQTLLEALWPLLAEDGLLLYVTCSVLRCENDRQIERFVAAHSAAELDRARQWFPGEADGDGFYYACVKKRG